MGKGQWGWKGHSDSSHKSGLKAEKSGGIPGSPEDPEWMVMAPGPRSCVNSEGSVLETWISGDDELIWGCEGLRPQKLTKVEPSKLESEVPNNVAENQTLFAYKADTIMLFQRKQYKIVFPCPWGGGMMEAPVDSWNNNGANRPCGPSCTCKPRIRLNL